MKRVIEFDMNEDIECECGNTVSGEGFFTCDEKGNQIEPTIESEWDGLYICERCKQIFKQKLK